MISLKSNKNKDNQNEEIPIPKIFPGISSYKKILIFGLFPAVKMENTNHVYVCKTWRWRPLIPFLIILCGLFFLTMSSIFLFPKFGFEGKIANGVSTLFIILFVITYLQTIFIGPGFFPFFWSEQKKNYNQIHLNQGFQFKKAQTNQDQITESILHGIDNLEGINQNYDLNIDLSMHDDESPSGIITRQEQFIWAKSKQRPPRSVISKEAGRIIIRPDHFCGVTLSWIGKRNQKFFLLFNLYATLFSLTLFIYSLRLIIMQIRKGWCWHFDFLFSFVIVVVGFQFGGLSMMFGLVSLYHTCRGTTLLEEQMNLGNRFNRGCKNNMEDICGSCWLFPCWFCPTNPWGSKSNEELVSNYISYYDDSLFTNNN
ncbi:hypothetical protein M9Y10_010039 [Tritrichomonas musculus]|uniref:Palmitoyltransferase n=1 Tax=Tritrichomonas musculus TaxID=1915356 RepID=A0ABR2IQ79_9EUKA